MTAITSDRGAVTIDWVALTAAVLILGIAVVHTVYSGGVVPVATTITDTLGDLSDRECAEDSQTSLEDRVATLECGQ